MLTSEVIRKAIPGASDELCHFVLWARTPFPMGGITARSLYKAAARLRRAGENGRQLCDHCDNLDQTGGGICNACDRALNPRRAS